MIETLRDITAALALTLAVVLPGCRPAQTPPDTGASQQPAALQNVAGPLVGVFAGTVPCADCSGIQNELTLRATSPTRVSDGTYTLKETYLGTSSGDRAFESSGRWLVLRGTPENNDATVIQLNDARRADPRYFLRVGDEALRLLDREQREIVSAGNHTLTRLPRSEPGGYATIDANDPGVRAAAAFALGARAPSGGPSPSLRAIVSAERQLVAGLNYRLCLDIDAAGASQRVLAVVYRDPKQGFHLSQWTPGGCDRR